MKPVPRWCILAKGLLNTSYTLQDSYKHIAIHFWLLATGIWLLATESLPPARSKQREARSNKYRHPPAAP